MSSERLQFRHGEDRARLTPHEMRDIAPRGDGRWPRVGTRRTADRLHLDGPLHDYPDRQPIYRYTIR